MADNETRVLYKALANFSAVGRAARKAQKEVAAMQAEEAAGNKASAAGSATAGAAAERAAKSFEEKAAAAGRVKKSLSESARETISAAAASKKAAAAANDETSARKGATEATNQYGDMTRRAAREMENAARSGARHRAEIGRNSGVLGKATESLRRFRQENNSASKAMQAAVSPAKRLNDGLTKFGNFRPRLTPPFVALVPAIAGLLGLLNPLVALLGAGGAAAIGFASSLGSIAGAALALPGLLSGVAAGISGVVVAVGGVGGVFKAFGAMKKAKAAPGGGATGPTEAEKARAIRNATLDIAYAQQDLGRAYEDAAEEISDAERAVVKAQRASKKAQEDLNDARKDALEDLQDLRKEVSRAGLDEERAIANLVKAREEYNNVMADPGSTRGDKLDAAVSIKEAEADLADVREQNTKNQQDLIAAEKLGVEGSERVVDAKEAVVDANEAERDSIRELTRAREDEARTIEQAQRRLADAYEALDKARRGSGAGGADATATDAFQQALDKLSPSARAFALGILSMQAAWQDMQRAVQESFFREIIGDLDEINSLIPVFGNLWEKAAGAMGRVTSQGINMLASGPWTRDFGVIADNNVGIIEGLGNTFLSLMTIVKDLIIAAAPFTQRVVDGWAAGADNLERLVRAGRDSGSIAGYLETVSTRLGQWWEIIKNIGVTLINFGIAASDFGDWITTGFQRVTEGWRATSEEAKKEGSPFKLWLEDVKEPLRAVRRLFSAFFDWLGKTASDPENLESLTRILDLITNDLGPAVGRLFDALQDSGIAEDLIGILADIVDIIADLVEEGGGEGFKAFTESLKNFFGFLRDVANLPGGSTIIAGIATALGTLAAISFVGKFTGLSALLNLLIKASGTKGVSSILDKIGKSVGTKVSDGVGTVLGTSGKGKHKTGVPLTPSAANDLDTPLVLPTGKGRRAAKPVKTSVWDKIGGAGTKAPNISKVLKGVGVLGGLTAAASVVSDAWGGKKNPGRDVFTSVLSGDKTKQAEAANAALRGKKNFGDYLGAGAGGAAAGVLAGSAAGPYGALAGGLGGFVAAAAPTGMELAVKNGKGLMDGLGSAQGWLDRASENIRTWVSELPQNVASWGADIWSGLQGVGPWLAERWEDFKTWLGELPFKIGVAAGVLWKNIVGFNGWLGERWEEFRVWVADLPRRIGEAAGKLWDKLVTFNTWLGERDEEFRVWVADLPRRIGEAAGDLWRDLTKPGSWLGDRGREFYSWATGLPGELGRAASNLWNSLPGIWLRLQQFAGEVRTWAADLPRVIGDAAGNIFGGLRGWITSGIKDVVRGFGIGVGDASRSNPGAAGSIGPGGSGPAAARAQAAVAGTGLRVTSTYRTPAQNRAVGGVPNSYHTDKANPAVDLAGSTRQMDAAYAKLKAVGGWRQLLYRVKGHYDHIHVANKGGIVPGTGSRDTVPSMLTPGEYVIRKAIVEKLGRENLAALNAGGAGLLSMMQGAQMGAGVKTKQMDTGLGTSGGGFSGFDGGGLTPSVSSNISSSFSASLSGPRETMSSGSGGGIHYHIDSITIMNPTGETSNESVARGLRNMKYAATGQDF